MDKLADILRTAGVDVSTLDVIFQADMEMIHRLTVPGAQAIETWEKLRGLVPQTGCWPVLLGDDDNLEVLRDNLKRLRYPRAVRILEEAATSTRWSGSRTAGWMRSTNSSGGWKMLSSRCNELIAKRCSPKRGRTAECRRGRGRRTPGRVTPSE